QNYSRTFWTTIGQKSYFRLYLNNPARFLDRLTFMYKDSCGFVCEDFPKENQMQANTQLPLFKH
ncbi:hypothetical protein K8352_19585, partial [Flavobacteriaceae bacterium F89]